jgi:hypothetical protein
MNRHIADLGRYLALARRKFGFKRPLGPSCSEMRESEGARLVTAISCWSRTEDKEDGKAEDSGADQGWTCKGHA